MTHFSYMSLKDKLFSSTLLVVLSLFLVSCTSFEKPRVGPPKVEISSPYSLNKLWEVQVDGFKPSDSEGLYLADDSKALYFGVPNGTVSKVIKSTQSRWTDQLTWQRKFNEAVLSGPILFKNNLIIGTAKGSLMSLAQQDGAVQWQTQLSSEVLSRGVLGDGSVFVRTVDGKLYSVNATSGKINWATEHSLPNLSLRGISPVTYHDGIVYVGWESGKVEALDATNGVSKWQMQLVIPKGRTDLERMVDIQSELIIRGGRLFALAYHGKLAAINPANGNLFWSKDISGFRDFLIDEKALYLVDENDILYAVDFTNGTQLWKQINYQAREVTGLAFYNDQQIVFADGGGYLHWIDRVDGITVARFKHADDNYDGEKITRVVVDQKAIYVVDVDGYTMAYQVEASDWYQFHNPNDSRQLFNQKARQ